MEMETEREERILLPSWRTCWVHQLRKSEVINNNNNKIFKWLLAFQNKIQPHKRLKRMLFIMTKHNIKRMLFIMTKHNMQISGISPFSELQNNA